MRLMILYLQVNLTMEIFKLLKKGQTNELEFKFKLFNLISIFLQLLQIVMRHNIKDLINLGFISK